MCVTHVPSVKYGNVDNPPLPRTQTRFSTSMQRKMKMDMIGVLKTGRVIPIIFCARELSYTLNKTGSCSDIGN